MILRWTLRSPRPSFRWRGAGITTRSQIANGKTSSIAAVFGPPGPSGTANITLDDDPANILATGPDGLLATPKWQTTDW